MASLQEVLSKYFSDSYLFDPSHSSWKDMMLQNDGWVSASQFFTFPDVAVYCTSELEVLEAAQKMPSLVVDASTKNLRRRTPLDLTADPIRRTIFAKPFHENTTDEEIIAFFQKYGTVKSIERRQYTAFNASTVSQNQRNRPSVFVEFETEEQAQKCVEGKPSFGRLNNCGDRFVPRLTVTMKGMHEQLVADQAEADFNRQKRQALMASAPAAAEDNNTPAPQKNSVTKFVPEGSILVIPVTPPGKSWRDLKASIGEIAKGKCSVVYTKTDPSGRTYVFMKTKEGAVATLDAFYALTGPAKEALVRTIPAMEILHGSEEKRVREQYLAVGNEQAQKKMAANEKQAQKQAVNQKKREREE